MIQTTLIEVITVVVSDCKVSMVYLLNQVLKNYSYTEKFFGMVSISNIH